MENWSDQDRLLQEFTRLFDTYKVPVYNYVQAITGDEYIAEEITQELFIKLWKRREKLGEIDNMDHYIYRAAHNASMSYFTKVALDAKLAKEVKRRMNTQSNNVSDHLNYQEARAMLEKAVATLSPQRKKVFELSRREGLRTQEIADELGLSFSTVNHHLTAALAQLRKYFLASGKDKIIMLLLFLMAVTPPVETHICR